MFTISCIFFYLDGFKLSSITIIKCIQIFSFISLPFILFLCSYYKIIFIDILHNVEDSNNNVNLHAHGHVSLDKYGAKAIGQGLSTIGSQIGLGATMVGVSTAVCKALAKSSIPPLQKAGLIVGASVIGGLGHSRISALNRSDITIENITTTSVSSTDISSHVNKLVDDSHISSLQESLFYGEMMSYVCLGLIYILIIQLVFKLYFKDKINLNLSKLLGNNINTKLEFYLNKIIKLNKQMSIVWI